jgi:DNA-binding XRE family transcriptional regulator
MGDVPIIPSTRLSPKKEKAAQLIARGETQAETARQLMVTKQTMGFWVREEEFIRRINELRTDVTVQTEEIFIDNLADAAQVVVDIMHGNVDDESKLTASRLKAALYILDRQKKSKTSIKSNKLLPRYDEPTDDEELDEILRRVD